MAEITHGYISLTASFVKNIYFYSFICWIYITCLSLSLWLTDRCTCCFKTDEWVWLILLSITAKTSALLKLHIYILCLWKCRESQFQIYLKKKQLTFKIKPWLFSSSDKDQFAEEEDDELKEVLDLRKIAVQLLQQEQQNRWQGLFFACLPYSTLWAKTNWIE